MSFCSIFFFWNVCSSVLLPSYKRDWCCPFNTYVSHLAALFYGWCNYIMGIDLSQWRAVIGGHNNYRLCLARGHMTITCYIDFLALCSSLVNVLNQIVYLLQDKNLLNAVHLVSLLVTLWTLNQDLICNDYDALNISSYSFQNNCNYCQRSLIA